MVEPALKDHEAMVLGSIVRLLRIYRSESADARALIPKLPSVRSVWKTESHIRAHIVSRKIVGATSIVDRVCEVCGAIYSHGHHDDYGKPESIRWLCPAHHTDWHRSSNPIYPTMPINWKPTARALKARGVSVCR